MNTDRHVIRSGGIEATIKADGAELCSLKNAGGLELLWQAGPEWPRHAPLLFPIVGQLKNDKLKHRGRIYPMMKHGIARDCRFDWVERGPGSCRLVLNDTAETRSRYPFPFRLTVAYTARDSELDVSLEIANTGKEMLPASIGGHPAFNWPLLPGLPKEAYSLTFSNEEPAPIRRLADGLMRAQPEPNPIRGKVLSLAESLFDDDAIILDRLASSSVCFAADRGPSIEMSWDDGFPQLGVWSKLGGAPFLCIEPWHGFADPVGFDGEFADKPGVMHFAPLEQRNFRYRIRLG
ncbi:aldose 1-epimerase family protein [Bradyrhizobium lablabi]|uniref:aldose 1-epimerase family protein n=1 Tax=Bradyrhizobium lablabi TaxID=722472 RepID=UPI001BAD05AC|nr:aldose 1-epimerase family protein [Bradyrhizobium lablabi]MBR1126349.1 aldose 1-epimerase family protein [Bradyrhizobium lablabi]